VIAPTLRLSVLLVAAFALALGATRVHPDDDRDLLSALSRADCAPEAADAPCFLGIRPGVTTWDEALERLQASPWVGSISAATGKRSLTWTWNGQQPAFLHSGHEQNALFAANGIVYRVDVQTGESLAAVLLDLGLPDAWNSFQSSMYDPQLRTRRETFWQSVLYNARHLEVNASGGSCPPSLRERLALPAQLSLFNRPSYLGYTEYSHTPLTLIADREGCA
jgi:hypothetical protein